MNKGFSLVIVFLLVSLGIIGYLAYQHTQLTKNIAQDRAEDVLEEPEFGYSGYDKGGPRYLFFGLPNDCIESDQIACITEDFSLRINPQAKGIDFGPHGSVPKESEVTLGNYKWDKKSFGSFSSYSLNHQGEYYLITVDYTPFSAAAEKYFEEILSTFGFIK